MRYSYLIFIIFLSCTSFESGIKDPNKKITYSNNYVSKDLTFPIEKESIIGHEYTINPNPLVIEDKLIYLMSNGRLSSFNIDKKIIYSTHRFEEAGNNELVQNASYVLAAQGIGEDNLQLMQIGEDEDIWVKTIPFGIESTPVIFGSSVFVAAASGEIYNLSIHSGETRWKKSSSKPVHADLVYFNKSVILANDAGEVIRYAAGSGDIIWQAELKSPIYSKVQIVNTEAWVFNTTGDFIRLDVETGKVLSKETYNAAFYANAAYDGKHVYIGNNDGHLYKIDNSGKQVWAFKTKELVKAQPLLGEKFVYFGDGSGTFYILDKETAEKKHKSIFRGRFIASPVFWEDKLLVFSDNDDVYLFQKETAKDTSSFSFF